MSVASPLLLLLLAPFLGLTVWAWASRRARAHGRRLGIALVLRCLMLSALICALAGLTWNRAQHEQAVAFVVDLSASTRSGQAFDMRYVNQALRQRPAADLAALVAVGANAMIEEPPARLTDLTGFQSVVDPDFTNLQAGLQLGAAVLPPDYGRRVVLLSDGRQNLGDAVGEARALHNAHVTVDVVPLSIHPGPEVRVDSVEAPASTHTGQTMPVSVQVTSTVTTSATVEILEDGAVVRTAQERISQGTTVLSYVLPAAGPGDHVVQVILQPAVDTLSQNNQGSALVSVSGPPRVLVVEGYAGAGNNVVPALEAAHSSVTRLLGSQVSADLTVLQRYAAIVLVDVPADELGQEVMTSLQSYVRDLGRGVVVIGGENSYSVGNYGSTPLEAEMPVSMDLPRRKDLPTAAVVLIVESLESDMSVNISKRASEGVIGLLTPRDQVAVSDAATGLVVPLQYVTNKAAIDATIDGMDPGDPPSYAPFLRQAALTLAKAKAQIKHIILLGDGDASDAYQPLLKQITALGIQVSTIETNASTTQDVRTMQNIAAWGGGKFYAANSVTTIPRIFLKVARTVAHTSISEGAFEPLVTADSPVLQALQTIPPLDGYAITTARPLATVVLASPKGDPILAQWQYGLGRVVAWTSDSLGRWSSAWLADAHARAVWLNMVNWVLPAPQSSTLQLSTSLNGTQATIAVDTPPGSAFSSVTGRETGPTGAQTLTLTRTAPYHFETTIPASAAGAYVLDLQATARGATRATALAGHVGGGFIVPYAPDYRDSGTDLPTLQAIAAAGDGKVLAQPAAAFAGNLQPISVPTSLQWPLLLLALLLLPLDVGIRRIALGPAEAMAFWRALRGRRVRTGPVDRHPLLTRVQAQRRRAPLAPPGPPTTPTAGLTPARTSRRLPPEPGPDHESSPAQADAPSQPDLAGGGPLPLITPAGQESGRAHETAAASSTQHLLQAKRRRRS